MAGMEDAWARVRRAEERLNALKDAIVTFRREHPDNESVGASHDGKGNLRLFARVKQRPPHEWGLAVGDIVVDLRCALDYAVYALAIANGGKPIPDFAHRLEFPISETEDRWKEAIGRHSLHAVDPHAIAYIRSVQPFVPDGGNVLTALEELVGVNKHRFIYPAWARLDAMQLKLTFEGMKDPFTADAKHIPGELKDGAELITFHLAASQRRAKFKVEASLKTFVVVEPTGKGWIRLDEWMPKMGAYIEYVIGELERFLTPGHQAPPPGTPIHLRPW